MRVNNDINVSLLNVAYHFFWFCTLRRKGWFDINFEHQSTWISNHMCCYSCFPRDWMRRSGHMTSVCCPMSDSPASSKPNHHVSFWQTCSMAIRQFTSKWTIVAEVQWWIDVVFNYVANDWWSALCALLSQIRIFLQCVQARESRDRCMASVTHM